MTKIVKYLLPAEMIDMGGIMVKQALPTHNIIQVDPFILLHHGKFKSTNLAPAIQQGIGPHPHRGFSPITFVLSGEIHHRDSRGNNRIAKEGEFQWLSAGAGIIHSERPSKSAAENETIQEMVQLWINTPASKKMDIPYYQFQQKNLIPHFLSKDGLVVNKLIAGKYEGVENTTTQTESDLCIIWAKAKKNGIQTIKLDNSFNSMIYIAKGNIKIKSYGIIEQEMLFVINNNVQEINIIANDNSEYFFLSGKPLDEKLVQQGPYVMNTETQILEAMRDYQMGKMGVLIEE